MPSTLYVPQGDFILAVNVPPASLPGLTTSIATNGITHARNIQRNQHLVFNFARCATLGIRAELRMKEPAESPAVRLVCVRLRAPGLRVFGVASAGYFAADVGSQTWGEAFQGGDFF